jgi:cytochrome c-type biogenesis protein
VEEQLFELFETAPYLVSLFAGVLTFFSPCVLPLIPAYLSYISGLTVKELSSEDVSLKNRLNILRASLMFVSGFGLIFILLGASMANLIGDIFAYDFVTYIAGAIIVIFGLHFMKVIDIKFLNYEARASFGDTDKKRSKLMQIFTPFLLGVSFALGWTPCIGPIFAGIVSMAAMDDSVKGLSLMIVYTLGLAIPFVVSALLTNKALGLFNRVKQHFRVVEIIAGLLLVIIGIAVATGGLGKLALLFS